ncbi:hypothetical protein HYH02_014065 [Chlamydomonas schloesseri]|uniref:Glycosyltransferase 2-like domain-containing protein n=1 Tax=Chlamydomonas schloesseri TaxID=2026947 RepID=A0A835SZR3_9CHLO|nr:hypothetical protein HYH02_014065 [Chlamydomonas schloesseri]|eukprot:KAG2429410.1 hypothetical protein HYH02_014065 [Chlamydomonas schloesseri]
MSFYRYSSCSNAVSFAVVALLALSCTSAAAAVGPLIPSSPPAADSPGAVLPLCYQLNDAMSIALAGDISSLAVLRRHLQLEQFHARRQLELELLDYEQQPASSEVAGGDGDLDDSSSTGAPSASARAEALARHAEQRRQHAQAAAALSSTLQTKLEQAAAGHQPGVAAAAAATNAAATTSDNDTGGTGASAGSAAATAAAAAQVAAAALPNLRFLPQCLISRLDPSLFSSPDLPQPQLPTITPASTPHPLATSSASGSPHPHLHHHLGAAAQQPHGAAALPGGPHADASSATTSSTATSTSSGSATSPYPPTETPSRPLVSLLVQYFNRPWMLPILAAPFRRCSSLHAATTPANATSFSSDEEAISRTRHLGFGIEMLINVDSRTDAAAVAEFAAGPLGAGGFVVPVYSNNVHEIRSYNRLARLARGKILVMLQDDDVFPEESACVWLSDVVRAFARWPRLGAVGSQRYVFNYHPNTTDWYVHFTDAGAGHVRVRPPPPHLLQQAQEEQEQAEQEEEQEQAEQEEEQEQAEQEEEQEQAEQEEEQEQAEQEEEQEQAEQEEEQEQAEQEEEQEQAEQEEEQEQAEQEEEQEQAEQEEEQEQAEQEEEQEQGQEGQGGEGGGEGESEQAEGARRRRGALRALQGQQGHAARHRQQAATASATASGLAPLPGQHQRRPLQQQHQQQRELGRERERQREREREVLKAEARVAAGQPRWRAPAGASWGDLAAVPRPPLRLHDDQDWVSSSPSSSSSLSLSHHDDHDHGGHSSAASASAATQQLRRSRLRRLRLLLHRRSALQEQEADAEAEEEGNDEGAAAATAAAADAGRQQHQQHQLAPSPDQQSGDGPQGAAQPGTGTGIDADAGGGEGEGEGEAGAGGPPPYEPPYIPLDAYDGRLRMQFVSIIDYAPIAVRRSSFLAVGGIDENMSEAGACGVHSDYDLTLRMWMAGWQVAYIEVPGLGKDPAEAEGGTHRKGVSGYCWERQWDQAIGYMRARWGQHNRWDPQSYYWFGSNTFEVVAEHVRLLNLQLLQPLAQPPGSYCPFGYGCEVEPRDNITGVPQQVQPPFGELSSWPKHTRVQAPWAPGWAAAQAAEGRKHGRGGHGERWADGQGQRRSGQLRRRRHWRQQLGHGGHGAGSAGTAPSGTGGAGDRGTAEAAAETSWGWRRLW